MRIVVRALIDTANGEEEKMDAGTAGAAVVSATSILKNPNLLDNALSGLTLIVVLSMILERALAVVYEWGPLEEFLTAKKLRAPIAFVVAYAICAEMRFDLLLELSGRDGATFSKFSVGVFVTAATIAGGSKGAITLFQDVLGFSKGGKAGEKGGKAGDKKADGGGSAGSGGTGGGN